jgi:hypothetical protein
MPLEPALYRRGLVGGIIVDDEMQVEIGLRAFVASCQITGRRLMRCPRASAK